ncbi:MAG: cation-translocating P-type ATPase [Bacteroidota bacterium]
MTGPDTHFAHHSAGIEAVISALGTDADHGLTTDEASERLKHYGKNSIGQKADRLALLILFEQFKSPIILLLLAAAGLSFWFNEWLDGIAILIVLIINSLIGFYMEFQAERSMRTLKQLSTVPARVIRNGQLTEITSDCIVPGDLVFAEAGDLIPADGRIIRLSQLQADESPLTGESMPVEKQTDALPAETALADRSNMLYKGAYISKGNAVMVVTGTGSSTELGKVAGLVRAARQTATPLEKKLELFAKKLIWITVVLAAVIFIIGLLYGRQLVEMLQTAVALAVAAIPEGLPIVATMALAQGMIRMARQNVIVKKLSAVETLGGTTVICTDKTGTLTENRIAVERIIPAGDKALQNILIASVMCNTAELNPQGGEEKGLGDPLEVALLRYAAQKGIDIHRLRADNPKIAEEPFSSETKIMCTLHKAANGNTVYAKGAAEELINYCSHIAEGQDEVRLDTEKRDHWLKTAEEQAASGLRVLAAAFRKNADRHEKLPANLVFLGLINMIDPPRVEVRPAITECRYAGIRIVMITGDHPATAINIAAQLTIADKNTGVIVGKEMKEYGQLTAADKDRWAATAIFARVSPKQKLDIVRVLQEKKNVVAMTGDGINDAPALKKADIGVAMGIRGTQVAQEVADMVLKDDSFTSIVLAVKQGRIIFDNIRKFAIFLLSCNLSEILVIAIAAIFNLHFQLFPIQILFINLVTDVLPALALGVSGGGADIMKRAPRDVNEPVIDKKHWKMIVFYASAIGLTSLGAVLLSHQLHHHSESENRQLCNNVLFFTLIFCQLLHVFNMADSRSAFFSSEVFKNRYVWIALSASMLIIFLVCAVEPARNVLSIQGMSRADWIISVTASFVSVLIIQAVKRWRIIND